MKNIENIYSLSPLQQGLLFHHSYAPESRVYHQQMSLRIEGRLDTVAFTTAWRQLMKRHAVLRTGFLWEDLDDAFQVVRSDLPLPLTELDWRDQDDSETALLELETAQRNAAFDLSQAPLMRLCLVRLAEQRWQLIWTHHHILLDGWSVGLVLKDWLALYQGLSCGTPVTLPPVRPYHDYIGWLAEQDNSAAESFWRAQLQDFAEPTPLPAFLARRPRPEGLPYAEQQRLLSAQETQALMGFARTRHLTLNTLIQGAWALLLGQYAGRDEVLFGVTLGGRPDTLVGADDMVGLFINTLPLRARWDDNPRLDTWLQRLQDANSELRQYEYTPLAKLKPLSAIPADRPLFESILVFENFPIDASLSAGADHLRFNTADSTTDEHGVRLTQGRNNFPLSLIVVPGETLELTLSYERARLADSEVRIMLDHLQALLRAMLMQAEQPVQALCWNTPDERAQLLAWGTGESHKVPDLCLHQLFERHADAHPDQPAVIGHQETLRYAELEQWANRLAHHFIALGVTPGQTVAIALERSPDFAIGLLAVLKAGACYLPLDLKQPPARLAELLADSDASYVVSTRQWQTALRLTEAQPIWLDDSKTLLQGCPDTRPAVEALTQDCGAYLIYTSGSTGQPKGALITHRAIVDYVTGVLHTLALPPASRFAMVSTVAADLGHTQLFGALCSGGTLCLVDDETGFNPLALADFMATQQVDVLKITPSHLRGLLAAHPDADLLPRHTLIFGGEALDAELIGQVRTLAPAVRLFNHYGPTETTVGAVINALDGRAFDTAIPLGTPLPNRRLYVLDAQGQPVPVGVPGELYIGGAALARGYLHRPELTRERFVPDPFAGGDARMYRTGDRVRWLANGELSFLGRVDNQVKIRGHRVELGEVEAQVKRLSPQIRQVLARVVQQPDQPLRLVAYIVADGALSAAKLRDDLSLRVPDTMVPSAFLTLDAIPLNANGKPDPKQLPLPDAPAAPRHHHVPPRNDIERLLVEIWQSVLKVESIGIHDNFFTLGGDSILSLQIIARANQQKLKLTPKQLFAYRTIAELSAALLADSPSAQACAQPQPQILPLSAGQHARLAAGPLQPTWRCLTLASNVEPDVLQRALQALVQQHQALQLTVKLHADGSWHQSVAIPAPQVTVSHRHVASDVLNTIDALAVLVEHSLANRLDVNAGQTLHACLLDDDSSQAVVLLAHPLLVDEEAWPLLLRDFALALAQIACDRPLALPQTGGEFADWVQHQHAYAKSDALEPAWEYWLQHADLALPTLEIPTGTTASAQTIRLDTEQTQRLAKLQQRTHAGWTGLLATAIAAELATVLDSETLLIDVQAGRPQRARLPLSAAIAATDFNPAEVVGALSHPTPLFLHWRRDASLVEQLQDVATQLTTQPQLGADYGVLRYLSDNSYLQEPLLSLPRAQIGLAVLGDWDAHVEAHGVLGKVLTASALPAHTHALHVSVYLQQEQLCLACQGPLAARWSERLATRLATLAAFADIDTIVPPLHAFPLCASFNIDPHTMPLDWTQVEDLYPLSAMQQGMLLHTLLQPHSGMYLVQQRYRWEGPLDQQALESAWQQLLARHPMLRTGFWWQDDQAPLQYVYHQVDAPFAWYDWRTLAPEVQEQQRDAVLAAERHQGFDLRRAPLTHLRVFRLSEHEYELVRSYHHILVDGWCFGLLMQDLFHLYQTALLRQPVARPLGRPFRDYITWLMQQDVSAAQRFWQTELAGFSEPTPLSIDRNTTDKSAAAHAVEECGTTLSVTQTNALLQLCQQHQLTPNTWIQGAWAILLARYSGKSDVLFGVTVAGRPSELAGAENIVGLFINSLPLRVAVEDDQPVVPWLQGLFSRNVELRQHEHTPLVDIQRWSDCEPGRALFDSLVVFENAPLDVGDTARTLHFSIDMVDDRSHTNYPLTLLAIPGDRMGIRLSYNRQRFAHDAVERLLGHLVQLLSTMLEHPHATLGTLDLLTPAERQLMLSDWNRSEADFPLDQTYASLFAQRVAAHPERIAAVCQGESLTYAELDRRANRLAQALIAAGARPDTIVALMAERGLPLLTMMIAVFKAGAAYQPLDVNHPPQRLSELLNLSAAPIVLASECASTLLDRVLASVARQPTCLVTEALWLQGDARSPSPVGSPDNLAYVIFTSGSTGTPKGAMVEQRGMLNNIYGKLPAIGLSETDRLAQTASPAFDISVWQFLAAPLVGATVHILPDAITHYPARLMEAIDNDGITLMEVVPSVIRAMLDMCPPHVTLYSLRWLMSIGEALPPPLCRQWFARFPQVPLMNLYGPAECADNIAFHPITAAPQDDCVHMPVGRPTANNQLFILDQALRPVPIGVPGEICTAGTGVGRGYLNDPERTQAVFVPHPFQLGARFYRTGDLGRYRPDGVIEFLGRRDQQVKVLGHRIELGEIENRLMRHAAVHAAAVLAMHDDRSGTRLIAYWQAKPNARVDDQVLRDYLVQELPPYMVPAAFMQLEQLPLNANGKLDRKALAARQTDLPDAIRQHYIAPCTPTETQLAAIWADILALPQIGVDDSFFALGGHSLLATQVISRVRTQFKQELPLRALFDHPTVAALARTIDEALLLQQEQAPLPPIAPVPRTERLPLSFAQQRLWFLEQLNPGTSVFNIPFALRLSGELDTEALRQSFEMLIARHEVLRTAVVSEQGEPWQQIRPAQRFELPQIDLTTLDAQTQQTMVRQYLDQVFLQAFDLQQPPLLRACLLKLDRQQALLAVAIHHIAADGWSIALLVDDLTAIYAPLRQSASPELAPQSLQYADYAVWQRQHLPGRVWQQQLAYWRQQLAGSPAVLTLPGVREPVAAGSRRGQRHRRQLPVSLTQALQQRADQHDATLFMVLYAALNVLLHQQTGRADLIVGADVANRHRAETESMVGFFVNQLVLRCRLQGNQTFASLMRDCRTTTLDAYQHQDLPFDALVTELLPRRDAHHAPFFQIKLVLQNALQRDLQLAGLHAEEMALEPQASELDLLINAIANQDGLQIVYDYDPDRYPPTVIERFDALYTALLQMIVDSDERTIDELVSQLQQESPQESPDALRTTRALQQAALGQVRRKSVTFERS